MHRLIILYGHPQDPEEFERYLHQKHLPLVAKMPELKRFTFREFEPTDPGEQPPFYRVASLYMETHAELLTMLNSSESWAALADLYNFATGGVVMLVDDDNVLIPCSLSPALSTEFYSPLNKRSAVLLSPSQDGLFALAQDVTEQKQAEDQLKFHARPAQSTSEAVITLDADYNILSWDDATEALYGWKRHEILGKHIPDVLVTELPHSDVDWKADGTWREKIRTLGSWKGEVLQKRKDGTSILVLTSIYLIKDRAGEVTGVVVINHR